MTSVHVYWKGPSEIIWSFKDWISQNSLLQNAERNKFSKIFSESRFGFRISFSKNLFDSGFFKNLHKLLGHLNLWWKSWECFKEKNPQEFHKLDNSKLGSTQQQKICWHWHVAGIISSQKMYGLYARKHHIVEMRGDVTDAGQTTDNKWR